MPSVVATVAHDFPITAAEREGDMDLLAIIATDLEAVRAPAHIRAAHRDPAVVTAFGAGRMTVEQEIVELDHPMKAFVVRRRPAFCLSIPAQHRPWQQDRIPSAMKAQDCAD
jgi:hypothetical protein